MASDPGFVEHVVDQLRGSGPVSYRKMFGEYAVYMGPKVVALICDDQLFLKPTAEGRALLGEPVEVPPYPGAKPHFLIGAELDDRDLLGALFRATAAVLPLPKPKRKRSGDSARGREPR